MKKDVMIVTGAGQISMAIVRRTGFGKKIVLGDKNMENCEAIAKIMNDAGYEDARPVYAGEVPDLSGYTTIYIGSPVWWGDWPMIMYTFFEDNKDAFAGKTLLPFNTNGGSGLSGFDTKLAETCPDSTVGEGLAIKGADAQNNQDSVRDAVSEWLKEQKSE